MPPTPRVWINRTHQRWPPASEGWASEAALAALAAEAGHPWLEAEQVELGIVLASDAKVRKLNRRHRGLDKPTNVLSFALNDGSGSPGPLLGDVVIAYETTAAEAVTQELTLADHLRHLVIHGVLHLLGYDHERSEAEAQRQEAREVDILARLGVADPYA